MSIPPDIALFCSTVAIPREDTREGADITVASVPYGQSLLLQASQRKQNSIFSWYRLVQCAFESNCRLSTTVVKVDTLPRRP